jgi:putative tryptophan/tyrosine transport system substrate-binding protein
MIRRREFIAGLGGAAAWPMVARAQQGAAIPVIGFLNNLAPGSDPQLAAAFHQALNETGYMEGRNVAIEYRWAENQHDRLPAMAADLVRRQVAVIAVVGTPAVLAAKAATRTIPIVFGSAADPVEMGWVGSLARPDSNLTGATVLISEVAAKLLEVMHELVPMARTMALLTNPTNPTLAEFETKAMQVAARVLGVHLLVLTASNQSEIEAAFAAYAHSMAGALLISGDALFITERDRIFAHAKRHGCLRYILSANLQKLAALSATERV